ncbi:SUKH-4 family immunity protein [Kitasatospora sp. LaBMicrA B282]|uniref:SUKH-4 family immunity protein n=1 Tax=Kitasatospora sp. LaBMicrA B282 TaxID=3420949 RepID=UPI003D0CDDE1
MHPQQPVLDLTADQLAAWFGSEGLTRIPESALPAGLTHEPTRRLLSTLGLPSGTRALIDFELDPEVLLAPLPEHLAWAPQLLRVGRVLRDWVVLDGATGQVSLAARERRARTAEPAGDLLASDLSLLLRFAGEVGELATRPEHTAQTAARLRELDPAVFDASASGQAPLWSALLFGYGLRAAARPGRELAWEVTPELLAEFATPHPLAEADLPATLTHQPTRRLLLTLGLPECDLLTPDSERPLATLRERQEWLVDELTEERAHQLDQISLGDTVYGCDLLVDGATGRIEVGEGGGDEGWPAAPLHRDLSACYLALWLLTRLRAEAERWVRGHRPADWHVVRTERVLAELALHLLADLDPVSCADESSLWPALADDGHMGGLLGC